MGVWTAPEGTFTIEEFKRLPLEGHRWELLDGTVVQMEPHGAAISVLTARLSSAITRHVEEHHLGVTLGAGCGFRLWPDQETVRVTDISFMSRERIPDRREWNDFPRTAPDMTVEVFSPFELPATVIGRMAMFLQAGTRLVWLVDPEQKTITVLASGKPTDVLKLGDILDGGDVLPGFSIPVATIFA